MSDQATAITTQTAAAPAATEAPAAPQAPVEAAPAAAVAEPTAAPDLTGMNVAQRKRALRDHFGQSARRVSEQPATEPAAPAPQQLIVDAQGNIHAPENGQFAGRAAEAATVADATAAAPPAEPQAATAPPVLIRVPVPEGHSLREQGITEIPSTPESERAIRALLNSDVRRRQVETVVQEAQQRVSAAEQRALRAEARMQALAMQRDGALSNPEVAARYAELNEAWGKPEADRYLRGVQAEYEAQLTESQATADAQYQQQAEEQQQHTQGQQFAASVMDNARQLNIADWWLKENAYEELGSYGWRMVNNGQQPDPAQALRLLLRAYTEDPRVKPHLDAARIKQAQDAVGQIQRQADARALAARQAEEAERLKAAATRHATRPPMTPAAQTGAQVPVDDENALRQMSPDKQRKTLRNFWSNAARSR